MTDYNAYEVKMAEGAAEYEEVVAELRRHGFSASFTQTGGMNAAIEVELNDGYSLLVVGYEDPLPWNRDIDAGWGVGLYRELIGPDPICFLTTEDGSTSSLISLLEHLIQAPSAPLEILNVKTGAPRR